VKGPGLLERRDAVRRSVTLFADEIRAYNRFPLRDYSSYGSALGLDNVVFEAANLARFFGRGNNMFNPSLLLACYGKLAPGLKRYFDLMVLGLPADESNLPPKIAANLPLLSDAGIIARDNGQVRFTFRLIEFEGVFFVTDMYSREEDMVWLSADSLNTARAIRPAVERALASAPGKLDIVDLCCGSGLVGLWSARQVGARLGSVGGLDINPRAVELARLNCIVNDLGEDPPYVTASIYDHAFSGQFDLLVSNPAYGSSPYELERLCHRSGSTGTEQVVSAFKHAQAKLKPTGVFAFMSDSPVIDGRIVLVDELELLNGGAFEIAYEVLYEYDPSGTRIKAADGSRQFRRQRSVVTGWRNPGAGRVSVSRNRLFNLLNHF
jgi:SAM-dependent methyltransferase